MPCCKLLTGFTHNSIKRKMWITPFKIKDFVLDLVFPKTCVLCLQEGEFLCRMCSVLLIVKSPSCLICKKRDLCGKICRSCCKKTPVRRFYAPFVYRNEVVRRLIHIYKYERAKELYRPLSAFAITAMQKANFSPKKNMIIIPVPLHWRRRHERGFNQAELIAEEIGEAFDLPILKKALTRVKNTSAQIELKNDSLRQKNIENAFVVRDTNMIKKKTILLVDDVVTSGATINEAAKVLKKTGAKSVWATAIARR